MLKTVRLRMNSALLLALAIMVFLVWIGCFAGVEVAGAMGIVPFLPWAFAVAFGIGAATTLYVAHPTKSAGTE